MEKKQFKHCKILVADDDIEVATKIREILVEKGYTNVTSKSNIVSMQEIEDYQLVILDVIWYGDTKPKHQLNDKFGINAAKYLRDMCPECKIILISTKSTYDFDNITEISESKICDAYFKSNLDSSEILRRITKIAADVDSSHYKELELFLRKVNLAKDILFEVDGYIENKPSWIGISNKNHADFWRNILVIENMYRDRKYFNNTLLQISINNISVALNESIDTIKKDFFKLLQEIIVMASNLQINTLNTNIVNPILQSTRDKVFISYSHKDKKYLQDLKTMLAPLIRGQKIIAWDDSKIEVGSEWRKEIENALNSAKVAVLMVSHNFLASDFISEHELPQLLKAAKEEGLNVLCVHVSHSMYKETEIEIYQAAHEPSRPLGSLSKAKRDQVLVEICEKIQKAFNS